MNLDTDYLYDTINNPSAKKLRKRHSSLDYDSNNSVTDESNKPTMTYDHNKPINTYQDLFKANFYDPHNIYNNSPQHLYNNIKTFNYGTQQAFIDLFSASKITNDRLLNDQIKLYAAVAYNDFYNDDKFLLQQLENPKLYTGRTIQSFLNFLGDNTKIRSNPKIMKCILATACNTMNKASKKDKIDLIKHIAINTDDDKILQPCISALNANGCDDWLFLPNCQTENIDYFINLANNPNIKDKNFKSAIFELLAKNNYLEGALNEKYPDMPFAEQLLRETTAVTKSDNPEDKEFFYNCIMGYDDEKLLDMDSEIMRYLVNNFTQENLDAVNNFRGMYGLKVTYTYGDISDTNINSVKRLQFDAMVGKVEDERFRSMLHTKEFLEFKPDNNHKFKYNDYDRLDDESIAIKSLKEYGFDEYIGTVKDMFCNMHVPPKIAVKFNLKDINEMVAKNNEYEYYVAYDEWDGRYFHKDRFALSELKSGHKIEDARHAFWKEVAKNKKLVKTISADLTDDNVTIDEIWENAANVGDPYVYRATNFQVHHKKPLKDGGENTPDNFVIVNKLSHQFLHQQDSPLIELYENPNAKTPQDKIATQEPVTPNARRIRIINEFTNEDSHHKVIYYGGPHPQSCYRGLLHDMTNTKEKAQQYVKEVKKKEREIEVAVNLVFAHIKKQLDL